MKPVILCIFTALFIGLTQSSCSNSTIANDTVSAICFDEKTGYEFEYNDMTGELLHYYSDLELNEMLYNRYDNKPSNNNIKERSLTDHWASCKAKVSGVCANNHVIAWSSTGAAFISAVAATISAAQSKSNNSPRSICNNYKNGGEICISWASYYQRDMTQQQIDEISRHCWNTCQIDNNSCEARAESADVTMYYCISNRADGCVANPGAIKDC